jgi:hypothetical protein
VLVSAKVPPMRSMFFATIDRPSPAPAAEVRAASPRKKGLVSCESRAGSTPAPWSRTLISTASLLACAWIVHVGHAGGRRLAVAPRVLHQVGDDARELDLVGHHAQVGRHVDLDVHLVVVLHGVGAGVDHVAQQHRARSSTWSGRA